MIKAICTDYASKNYNGLLKNNFMPSFKSLHNTKDRDIFIRQSESDKESFEMTKKKAQYLLEDSKTQYESAKETLSSLKQEIIQNLGDMKSNKYKTIHDFQGKKYIAEADFSYDGEEIQINRLIKQNPNGSIDKIETDENGNIIKISNGIIPIENGGIHINEQFFYNNEELENVKLSTTIGKRQAFTMQEFIYSNGALQQFYRYVKEK